MDLIVSIDEVYSLPINQNIRVSALLYEVEANELTLSASLRRHVK